MKKEIHIREISDDETNYNLEQEEQIWQAIVKESELKAVLLFISIIIWVFWVIYVVLASLIPNVSLEEIRVENFKKANSYVEVNKKNLLQAEKMVEIYEKRISEGNWCISANQEKWVAKDCFIFNK